MVIKKLSNKCDMLNKIFPLSAGVGMTFSDASPFCVLDFVPAGPSAAAFQQGMLRIGDILESVGGNYISSLTAS